MAVYMATEKKRPDTLHPHQITTMKTLQNDPRLD
jgi:hypothetical protein